MKIIIRIIKEKTRNYDFYHMMKYVEKEECGSLKTLHVKNKNNTIIKTITNINKIEQEIMK